MIRFLAVAALGLVVGAGGAALAHDMAGMHATLVQVAATQPNAIDIDNFDFGPQSLTVAAGATVTWTNHDDEPHTVVSADDPRLFKSGPLDTDDKFTFTFTKPGTYKYFCSIHPHMTGTVIVK